MTDQPAAKIPRYKCHKEVWALKIASLVVYGPGPFILTPADMRYAAFEVSGEWVANRYKGTSEDPGYYVVYTDGYTSWSPSKAFEEGYTRID